MYRCNFCHFVSRPGDKLARVVTAQRERIYRFGGDRVSRGHEVVSEAAVHPGCAEKLTDPAVIPLSDADRGTWLAATGVPAAPPKPAAPPEPVA